MGRLQREIEPEEVIKKSRFFGTSFDISMPL